MKYNIKCKYKLGDTFDYNNSFDYRNLKLRISSIFIDIEKDTIPAVRYTFEYLGKDILGGDTWKTLTLEKSPVLLKNPGDYIDEDVISKTFKQTTETEGCEYSFDTKYDFEERLLSCVNGQKGDDIESFACECPIFAGTLFSVDRIRYIRSIHENKLYTSSIFYIYNRKNCIYDGFIHCMTNDLTDRDIYDIRPERLCMSMDKIDIDKWMKIIIDSCVDALNNKHEPILECDLYDNDGNAKRSEVVPTNYVNTFAGIFDALGYHDKAYKMWIESKEEYKFKEIKYKQEKKENKQKKITNKVDSLLNSLSEDEIEQLKKALLTSDK